MSLLFPLCPVILFLGGWRSGGAGEEAAAPLALTTPSYRSSHQTARPGRTPQTMALGDTKGIYRPAGNSCCCLL